MDKEIYVQSINLARAKNIPKTLFGVVLKGLTKKEIYAFMNANDIVTTLSCDPGLKIILADITTRNEFAMQLSGTPKDSFVLLERNKDKYISIAN